MTGNRGAGTIAARTLSDETRIGAMTLRNRFVRSATWEAMADETGRPTPRLIEVYRELAEGGIGLIIASATTITRDATTLPGLLSIADDSVLPEYREMTRIVHNAGCPIVLQLTFIGRNGEMWSPATPSREDLRNIAEAFGDAARRARDAGFDGVQIHSGHGFFLSRFLNARMNQRTDAYGGSVGNRARFLVEIYNAIRARVGDAFSVLVKINCSDFEENDGVFDACREACRTLAKQGINAIEVTGGVSGAAFPPEGLAYDESVFRDYAAEIAREADVPVILVGVNRTPAVMREILSATRIGYFSLSRPLLREPNLPRIWSESPDVPAECTSCDACRNQPDGNVCPFRE